MGGLHYAIPVESRSVRNEKERPQGQERSLAEQITTSKQQIAMFELRYGAMKKTGDPTPTSSLLAASLEEPESPEQKVIRERLAELYKKHDSGDCDFQERQRTLGTTGLRDLDRLLFGGRLARKTVLQWGNAPGTFGYTDSRWRPDEITGDITPHHRIVLQPCELWTPDWDYGLRMTWGSLIHELLHVYLTEATCDTHYASLDRAEMAAKGWQPEHMESCPCGKWVVHGPEFDGLAAKLAQRLQIPEIDALAINDNYGMCHYGDCVMEEEDPDSQEWRRLVGSVHCSGVSGSIGGWLGQAGAAAEEDSGYAVTSKEDLVSDGHKAERPVFGPPRPPPVSETGLFLSSGSPLDV